MRAAGLRPGDVAGVFLPLVPEAVIVMYACFKTGVAVLPVFSGFGPEGLAERLAHAGAKILFTVDGAIRRGKTIPLKATADLALERERRRQTGPAVRIPAHEIAYDQLERLIAERGKIRYGALKTDKNDCDELPQHVRKKLNLWRTTGVMLRNPPRRLNQAGLRHNDVVTAVNGRPVVNWMHMRVRLAHFKPGTKVKLTLDRGAEVEVALDEWDD